MTPIVVIYASPSDYPGLHVAREFFPFGVSGYVFVKTQPLFVGETIEAARGAVTDAYPQLCRADRHPGDDPAIVEVWL